MKACLLSVRSVGAFIGQHWALRQLSFELMGGEILAVLGPSGAGKTTLLRLLSGELTPDEGAVFLQGCDVGAQPLWKRARLGVGYVPQTPSVLLDLSVRENLTTFMHIAGASGSAQDWAHSLDLQRCLDTTARHLSGGERRRLELLRAALAAPRLFLCDEPFAGLDPDCVRAVSALFVRLRDQGAALVLADHRVNEILEVADRALLLVDGRLELIDSKANFMKHPAVEGRYVG